MPPLTLYAKVYDTLEDHDKTTEAVARFGCNFEPVNGFIGAMARLWLFVMKQYPDGNITKAKPSKLAEKAGFTGDPENFLGTLVDIGFADREPTTGEILIHDWEGFASGHSSTERVKKHREKQRLIDLSNGKREQGKHYETDETLHDVTCNVTETFHETDETPLDQNRIDQNRIEEEHRFPLQKSREYVIPLDKISEWGNTYPALDLPAELRSARQHVRDNPSKLSPSPRGVNIFVGKWLRRSAKWAGEAEAKKRPVHAMSLPGGINLAEYDPDA